MSFAEFRTQELEGWDQRAEVYEGLTARVTTQTIPALLSGVRARVGLSILDICSGPGFAAGAADAIGATAKGIDFAPGMVRIARQRFPRLTFQEGDALALEDPDASYDAVVCNFGVFHLPTLYLRSEKHFEFCDPVDVMPLANGRHQKTHRFSLASLAR